MLVSHSFIIFARLVIRSFVLVFLFVCTACIAGSFFSFIVETVVPAGIVHSISSIK